jgi:hypothetical protein
MSTQPIDEEVFYEGKFSLVQLNIPSTSELFNIGVIFEQSENNIFHTKFLDNFDRLTTCLRIKDIGNISNYSQKMATLKETADDNGFTLLDTTSAEEFIGYIYEKTNILQLQE